MSERKPQHARVRATINGHHLPMLCRMNPQTGRWEQVLPTTDGRVITVPLKGVPPLWATILHPVVLPLWRRLALAVVRAPRRLARLLVPGGRIG